MGVTILKEEEIPATSKPILWVDDSNGYRMAFSEGVCIAAEDDAEMAACARWRLRIASNSKVAIIGGGFCVLPRLLTDCAVTVYEVEAELQQFCPTTCEFIVGDWNETLTIKYDVIVYDTGTPLDDASKSKLEAHCATLLT